MRTVIALVLLLVLLSPLHAQCDWYSVSVYPKKSVISKNPIIVVEGFSAGMDVINELSKHNSLYLKHATGRVKLLIKEVCTGQNLVAQVVFLPEKALTPGVEYTLAADSLPHNEQLIRWDSLAQKYGPIKYIVRESAGIGLPAMSQNPVKAKNQFYPASCGTGEYVDFDYQIKGMQAYFFKATLKNLTTGKTGSYYIWSDQSVISIGHGSCGGPFNWGKAEMYQLRLSYVDSVGGLHTITNPVTFKSPV